VNDEHLALLLIQLSWRPDMRYQNISGGSLLLPREDGRGGSLHIDKDGLFEGSSLYGKYVEAGFIQRVGQGTLYPAIMGTSDPVVFTLGKHLIRNGVIAEAKDQSAYPDSVVATTAYSVFGKVLWYDADGVLVDEVDFSVVGEGTHGSGATFVFGSSSAPTKPTVTGSIIDLRDGKITIKFDSGAPGGMVALEASFDYEYAGEHLHFGRVGEAVFNSPNTKTKTIYVSASDVSGDSVNYVTGSAGQVKHIRTFARGAQVGDRVKITTFRYRDSSNATKATNTDVSEGFVVADDLL
jgi:hypothetical protein